MSQGNSELVIKLPGARSSLGPFVIGPLLDQDGISDNIVLFNEKVREWEDYYNHRPHGALQNQTPFERLMEKTGAGVSQGS